MKKKGDEAFYDRLDPELWRHITKDKYKTKTNTK